MGDASAQSPDPLPPIPLLLPLMFTRAAEEVTRAYARVSPGVATPTAKAIYDKVQKIGLCKFNKTFKNWVHHLMSLPFLPEEDIRPTYLASHMPLVGLTPAELELFQEIFC